MKALLAVDGSAYTQRAARWIVQAASWLKAPPEIHLLHVHAPLPYPGAARALPEHAVEEYQRDESRAALTPAEDILRAAGLAFHSTWVVGDAAETIANYAQAHGMDVVVVGSHGRTPLMNLALGSVAARVVAKSKVPVVVAP
jgi:nucleotide-binding universal stress UspA family protein